MCPRKRTLVACPVILLASGEERERFGGQSSQEAGTERSQKVLVEGGGAAHNGTLVSKDMCVTQRNHH